MVFYISYVNTVRVITQCPEVEILNTKSEYAFWGLLEYEQSSSLTKSKWLMVLSNFPAKSLYPQVLPQSARRTQRHQKPQMWIGTFLNSAPSAISAVINHWVFRHLVNNPDGTLSLYTSRPADTLPYLPAEAVSMLWVPAALSPAN